MARSNSTTSTSRQPLALFAAIAILGQVVLLGSALLLPLVSEFGFVGDTISELVLGRFGWVQPPWAGPRGEKPEPWHWEYGVIS